MSAAVPAPSSEGGGPHETAPVPASTSTTTTQQPQSQPTNSSALTQSNLDSQTQDTTAEGPLQSVLHLEPDTNSVSDTDSAFDANSSASTSLASSILHYEYSNGRRYAGYRSGQYLLPNDEQEQDRLDLLHHIFLLILGGKLYDAPIGKQSGVVSEGEREEGGGGGGGGGGARDGGIEVKRVLDVGTGTGIWAIDFADEYPGAEIIGTDLSPIQPTWVPPNAKFYIDDAEAEWVYSASEAFDYIHVRTMSGSISDWDKLVQQSYSHLNPGGWAEFQEPLALAESDDGTLDKAVDLLRWQDLCNDAAAGFGKEIRVGDKLKAKMEAAGFVNVHEKVLKIPIGPWAKDPKMKEIGRYQREHMCLGIEPYTLGFIGKVLGWSEAECRVLIAKVINDTRNKAVHMYVRFYFVYGHKPKEAVH